MKKFLTVFTALLLFGSMTVVQAEDYYLAGSFNGWSTTDIANKMSWGAGQIYSKTISAMYPTSYQFQISTFNWGNQYGGYYRDNSQSNVSLMGTGQKENITFILSTTSDVTFYFNLMTQQVYVIATPVPSYTFPNGTTIYYDFTAYDGGVNVCINGGGEPWHENTSTIFSATLNAAWEVTATTNLFKSAPNNWSYKTCSTLPTEGQNMLVGDADGIGCHWDTYSGGMPEPTPATIQLHSNIKNPSWETSANFALAGNEETASLTLTGVTKGSYEFGLKIDGTWTSNGTAFTRANNSQAVVAGGSGNCTFNADRNGDYTFTWTYATNTLEIGYPAIPSQSVTFNSLASQILKGSVINLANCVTSSGIDEPTYRFYIKEKNGSYGDAINANYSFNANGEYVVKVEALEYGEPVAYDESAVVVYQSYTFTNGSTIYVDFTAVSGDVKGVNYPKANEVGMDWDGAGAGTIKTVTFTANVTWTTMAESFIKTEKNGWAAQPFTVPGTGKDMVIVAADGASYTWGTYVPAPPTVEMKGGWDEWADALVFEGDATSVSVTKHLDAGTYEFKVIIGGEWRGNGHTYHRDYTGAEGITTNGDNMVIEVDVEGNYTFTWTYENNALNIGFQECDYYIKNNWYGCGAWKWKGMKAGANGTYRIENVVYGGNGVNYNTTNADAGATWKDQTVLFYMDGSKRKEVTAYDTVNFVLDPANDTIWAEMVSKDLTVYTVASNSLALCDLGWAATHPYKYTDMTKQADGTYQWTKGGDEVLLPAGKIYIKVIKDRDYENGYWPTTEEGFEYTIAQSGIYTIEVNYNPCTHDITIDTTLVKTVNVKDLYIQGFGDLKNLVKDADNYKALATISLTAGTHNFSVVDGGSNKLGNGQAFTRENNSYREIVAESGADMTIEVDKAGEYLFTYVFEYEQLMIQYPTNVPAVKIAPIGGKFTINAKGDTAVFSRGNLQYNYEADEWYTAEKQYEVLGDLNLRFGDATYQGSIDLFGWSCESSDYGKQWKYKDEDFTGDFVDWGHLFDGGDQEWSTLSEAEWNFILARKQGNRKLWTMITLGVDSLNGLVLFPDDWTAPACASEMVYGFYDLDDAANYQKNSFTFAEWAEMEAAGAVFFPLAGARAGFWGNNWSGTAESDLSNPLSSGYDWVDNVNWMGYYWLSTVKSETQISSAILPGWHNNKWTAPTIWARERRRGQPVRLVTIIPKKDYEVVRGGLTAGNYYTVCYNKTMTEIRGASLWSFAGKDANMAYIIEEAAPYAAGTPYIIYAESDKLEALVEEVADPAAGSNNGLYGTFDYMDADALSSAGATYMLKDNELRPIGTNNHLAANRAYVILTDIQGGTPANVPGRRVKGMPLHKDTATGMDAINASDKPMKLIIDGNIYILRGEKMYDATGRQVK